MFQTQKMRDGNTEGQEERSLPEQISEALIDYILEQKLQKGDKLPNEYNLAQMLFVGRGTIREAIKILESRNIVTVKHGAGTFVCEKYGVSDDPLGLRFMDNKEKAVKDLVEMRIIIEPEIAAMAAQFAEEEDLKELERCCLEVERSMGEGRAHVKSDIFFHTQIAVCSKNSIATSIVPIIASSVRVFSELTDYSLMEETLSGHREITEAIKRHDYREARQFMMHHVMANKRSLAQLL